MNKKEKDEDALEDVEVGKDDETLDYIQCYARSYRIISKYGRLDLLAEDVASVDCNCWLLLAEVPIPSQWNTSNVSYVDTEVARASNLPQLLLWSTARGIDAHLSSDVEEWLEKRYADR